MFLFRSVPARWASCLRHHRAAAAAAAAAAIVGAVEAQRAKDKAARLAAAAAKAEADRQATALAEAAAVAAEAASAAEEDQFVENIDRLKAAVRDRRAGVDEVRTERPLVCRYLLVPREVFFSAGRVLGVVLVCTAK